MGDTGNGEKVQEVPVEAPTAESLPLSQRSGKRNTKSALTVSDRLEIFQQAAVDLGQVGIHVRVAPLHNDADGPSVVMVLPGVRVHEGRLIAINGTLAQVFSEAQP